MTVWRDGVPYSRRRTPGRFPRAAVLGCAAAVLIAGCTSSQPGSPPSPSPRPSSSARVSSASATRPSQRTVELSCADASAGNAPVGRGNASVDGLTLEGAGGQVGGSPPADVGLRVPDGPPLFFAKTPAYLKPGTPTTTVELPAGSSGYLAWIPAGIWTGASGQPIDLTRWMASRIVFHSCRHQASTYLGGLLSTEPGICLTLRVSQPSAAGQPRTVYLGGSGQC